jgi:hypothetical protein
MRREDGVVKVMDVGLTGPQSQSHTRITKSADIIGTAAYMAPEQSKRASAVGKTADVYSLGAVLWSLLAGEVMYPRDDVVAAMTAHEKEPIPKLSKIVSDAPIGVYDLFRRMVAKEAADRPQTMDEVVETLERILAEIDGSGGLVFPWGMGRIIREGRVLGELKTIVERGNGRAPGDRRVVVVNGLEVPLRWCPPGTFEMGSPKREAGRYADEKQARVTLTKGFWLGETAVTQELYKSVRGTNAASHKGARLPVEQVSWKDAVAFCAKLTERERSAGRLLATAEYRLPTEAEWEYACRAGTVTAYWFGDDAERFGEYGWYADNSGGHTHEVGLKPRNAWGLYDLHGNVWEWCGDVYVNKLEGGLDPFVTGGGSVRVYRGGGWSSTAGYCRSASRYWHDPSYRSNYLGFRLALSPSGELPEA